MSTLDEKRVYGEKAGRTELYVAAGMGVAVVSVSDDIVGEFTLDHRCAARDVAAGPDRLAVATDEDVLVSAEGGYTGTAFGPAVAVGFDGDRLLAAGPDGRVAARTDGAWTDLGTVTDVRAIGGRLVAGEEGVYRADDELTHVGLSDVRDVAGARQPLAATGDGLYYLGPGWAAALDGAFTVVASGPADDGDGPAHAATADALYERDGEAWVERSLPVDGRVTDVTHGTGTYAVTAEGVVLVDAGDGFRDRALGLRDVRAVAVAPRAGGS
jgi:hypothetical protein